MEGVDAVWSVLEENADTEWVGRVVIEAMSNLDRSLKRTLVENPDLAEEVFGPVWAAQPAVRIRFMRWERQVERGEL